MCVTALITVELMKILGKSAAMSHPGCRHCSQMPVPRPRSPPKWEIMEEANISEAMKLNSSSFLMRFELLCFILGNHVELGVI